MLHFTKWNCITIKKNNLNVYMFFFSNLAIWKIRYPLIALFSKRFSPTFLKYIYVFYLLLAIKWKYNFLGNFIIKWHIIKIHVPIHQNLWGKHIRSICCLFWLPSGEMFWPKSSCCLMPRLAPPFLCYWRPRRKRKPICFKGDMDHRISQWSN